MVLTALAFCAVFSTHLKSVKKKKSLPNGITFCHQLMPEYLQKQTLVFFWQCQDTKVFGHFLPQMVDPCWEVLRWKLVDFEKYGNVPFIPSSSMI